MYVHHDSDNPRQQYLQAPVYFLLVCALLIAAIGCYWTPKETHGDISVRVTGTLGSGIRASDFMEPEISIPSGFLTVLLLDDAVLGSGPAQAEQLFADLGSFDESYSEAASGYETFYLDLPAEEDFGSYEEYMDALLSAFEQFISTFQVSYSNAAQTALLRGGFFDYDLGSSGQMSFPSLPDGRTYLVVAEAGVYDPVHGEIEGVGYALAQIVAGQNTRVELTLGDRFAEYSAFLLDRYSFEYEYIVTEPEPTPASVLVSLSGTPLAGSSALYYELLDPTSPTEGFAEPWIGPAEYDTWFHSESVIVLDAERNVLAKTGSSPPLNPVDGVDDLYIIAGLVPEQQWRLLITQWASRESATAMDYAALTLDTFTAPNDPTASLSAEDFLVQFVC